MLYKLRTSVQIGQSLHTSINSPRFVNCYMNKDDYDQAAQ